MPQIPTSEEIFEYLREEAWMGRFCIKDEKYNTPITGLALYREIGRVIELYLKDYFEDG
jgi:hypothetical protein